MILLHATYRPYLSSIRKKGLLLSKVGQTYEISKDVEPCIYLTSDLERAFSFAETAMDEFDDNKFERFDGTIVILAVNTLYLNSLALINGDQNILDEGENLDWMYFENIPSSYIGIVNFKDLNIDMLTKVQRVTNKYLYKDLKFDRYSYLCRKYGFS